jgi:hypothetical protein
VTATGEGHASHRESAGSLAENASAFERCTDGDSNPKAADGLQAVNRNEL